MTASSGVWFEVVPHHVEPRLLVARGDLGALRGIRVALDALGFSYWPELHTYATEATARLAWPMVQALTTRDGYREAAARSTMAEALARPGASPALERYVARLDANRRQNPSGSFHRTRRRASPMAWAVCFARNESGWRYWHRGVRCFGALAQTASGEPCEPNDPRACAWCLTGWLARHRKPADALAVADVVWSAFPPSLQGRVLSREWCEPPESQDALDQLICHPLSLMWETGGSRWVERVLRLREGPIA